MGILDNIAAVFGRSPATETKEAPQVHISGPSYTETKKDNFKTFAQEGYKENAIVYRCVNEIANGAASIPFCVYQGDVKLDAHPLISLLNRPNPLQAGVEYFQSLYSYLLLSGNSYALQSGVNGIPRELHILRPDRIEIEPSSTAMPKSYKYKLGQEVIKVYPADPVTGAAEVKHFKLWNPLDDYQGLSPLAAAALSIDQNNMVSKHNIALLANGARPSGAIIFKPADDAGNRLMLTDGQRDQLQSDLNNRFKGVNNAGRPMLLEGDFDWKEMGMSPKDMDFMSQANMTAKDIALCFGVPSQLIGIPDAQTYANVQEARLALYEETIIPLARRIESDLNEWLVPQFNEDLTVKYDIDAIPAMTERRRRVYENVTSAVRDGIISRNEARERLGLEPISGGDEVFIAANLFPLGAPEVPEDQGEDPEDAGKQAYGEVFEEKYRVRTDTFTTRAEASARASEIGCTGTHQHTVDGQLVFMPCDTHAEYERRLKEKPKKPRNLDRYVSPDDMAYRQRKEDEEAEDHSSKAESDVDTVPTEAMARNAERGLALRKEYGRGGTEVGVARAVQLKSRERLSPRTVRRMHSYFSRHEVDKEAEGFRRGEAGWPSAGLVAWLLWGGDEGQDWARRKVSQLNDERDKGLELEAFFSEWGDEVNSEFKASKISEAVKKGLAEKVKDHNDKFGDQKGKRVTQRMLEAVFRRGVGAYNTNPASVRPSVRSADQWAYARVNGFLRAVRTGRFKSGKFDTDLLPEGHPLRSKEKA